MHRKGRYYGIYEYDTLDDGTYVPNDVCICGSDHARFILLTGPNMGGKSNLLCQVCLVVILAQVSPCRHVTYLIWIFFQ